MVHVFFFMGGTDLGGIGLDRSEWETGGINELLLV